MTGETNLAKLLASMSPVLSDENFVFVSFEQTSYGAHAELSPVAAILESEGLTLVVPKAKADDNDLVYESVYKCITLEVHSSLEAVGLTAAFTAKLTEVDVSANVIAGYYHDHIFVQCSDAEKAIFALKELSN